MHEWPVEEFDRILTTNLRGPFLVSQFAIPHLIEAGGGSIVHMSSVCAITVWAGDCGYDVSKAGLNMLSDHIAVGVRAARHPLEHADARRHPHRAARVGDGGDGRRPRVRARAARAATRSAASARSRRCAEAAVFLLRTDGATSSPARTSRSTARTAGSSAGAGHRRPDARPARSGLRPRRHVVGTGHDRRRGRDRRGRHAGSARPTSTPWIARACIEAPGTHTMDRGLRALLLGQDPLDPEAIWERLYVGTA